ncbi:MAG: response regulator transcription factor [Rhodospirillaceae bacterium]|nr:response regulator transcription factor [Rhodospirillaceae bacterium]
MSEHSQPHRRQRRLYLCVGDAEMREALRRALADIEGYELVVVPDPVDLGGQYGNGPTVVIACPQTLAALRRNSPAGVHALVRSAHVILALRSDQLQQAASLITMVDSLLFTDLQLDRAKEIVRASERGYFLTPKRFRVARPPHVGAELARSLSPVELEVLVRIGQGLGNRCIADHLGMSEASVKFIVHGLLGKLGMRNRTQLAIFVARQQRRDD